MSIGKIKMHGTKPVMEVTKTPRDTGEFEKIEQPNKAVQSAINKFTNKIQSFRTSDNQTKFKLNPKGEMPTEKDAKRFRHWTQHANRTADYSSLNRDGITPKDMGKDPYFVAKGYTGGYKHYKENVDADKDLYDYLMKSTGGNGEH